MRSPGWSERQRDALADLMARGPAANTVWLDPGSRLAGGFVVKWGETKPTPFAAYDRVIATAEARGAR